MKDLIFKPAYFFLFLFLGVGSITYASDDSFVFRKEFKKEISKEFDITADGQVDLSNKFGEISVNTWNKNKVQIDVEIKVYAGDQDDAQRVFNQIDVSFSNSASFVKAHTTISSGKKSGSWISSWWGGSMNTNDFTIDYKVYMPETNELDIYIAHGNAYVDIMKGRVSADVKHSDIHFKGVKDFLELEIAHGKGVIDAAENADVDIAHGGLKLKMGNNIKVDSRHSDITIQKAKMVKSYSAHDDYSIGFLDVLDMDAKHGEVDIESVRELDLESRYSDVDIEFLESRANCDFEFGDLDISEIANDFSEIKVRGRHCDIELNLAEGTNFEMDAKTEHGDIDYPSGMDIRLKSEKNHSSEIQGHSGKEGGGRVIVDLEHGDLDIEN